MESQTEITLEPDKSGVVPLKVNVTAAPGNYLITSDIRTNGMEFGEWAESLVTVE